MSASLLGLSSEMVQNIKHNAEVDYSVKITSKEVNVHCKTGKHNHGSSKVKLTNRIDYNWELKYYQGQLVAVHIGGKMVAYAMKGKDGGMVRIVNQETDKRALVKNLKTDVRDVSFAFIRNEIILGCVDDEGNVMIYQVEDSPTAITYTLLLHIYHPEHELGNSPANYKIVWCPYLPGADDEDPDGGDDTAKMFVFLNGSKAEVWDVSAITARYNEGPVQPDENYDGYVEIDHSMALVDVSFSSDGTAIATACLDGFVKFYQIYMVDNEKQKCLHEWIPHDGKRLSSLIFIDNILEYSSDSRFWKFAITGANHNSELKLWSCETWTCLQTIHFKLDPTAMIPNLYFKIAVDHSGQYVVMTDFNNKILYVLQIKRSDAEKLVAVTTISQFLLPSPFLSFYITEAETGKMLVPSDSTEDLYEDEDFDEENPNLTTSVLVKMLVIQPKKFQECTICYIPDVTTDISEEVISVELNKSKELDIIPKLDDLQTSVELLIQQTNKTQLNLMTPEDFTSTPSRPSSVRVSLENTEKLPNPVVENLIDFQRPQKDNFASGGSSPSREVQEILSLTNNSFNNQEYFDDLTKIDDDEVPTKHYDPKDTLIYPENTSWPKIPVVKDNEIIKDESLRHELGLSNSEDKNDWSNKQIDSVNFRLNSLESLIREQTLVIGKLQHELHKTKPAQSNDTSALFREELAKDLDLIMSKHQLQIAKLLENMLTIQKTQERELHDNLLGGLSKVMVKTLSDRMQAVITTEIKHSVVPAVTNIMENMKHQIDVQYSQKLNSTDLMLKESIAKLVNSKSISDSLSNSVVGIIAPSLEKCYRDMITSSLIPSWERICSTMFQQINDTFTQGTKEYTASVESYMDRQRKVQEKSKDLMTQINVVQENMKASSDKLMHSLSSEVHKQFNYAFKNLQDKLSASIRDTITEEVKAGFKSHASVIEDSVMQAVRSRSVTPASHVVDSQAAKLHRVQQCLQMGNHEEALQVALSAENLQYVVYVCTKVDVNTIFGGTCNLPQSCLLSMIQQLSMDLQMYTEVKFSYIHAALLAINKNDPDTKRFLHKVLSDLHTQLQQYVTSDPPFKLKSNAKILIMAIESINHSSFNII